MAVIPHICVASRSQRLIEDLLCSSQDHPPLTASRHTRCADVPQPEILWELQITRYWWLESTSGFQVQLQRFLHTLLSPTLQSHLTPPLPPPSVCRGHVYLLSVFPQVSSLPPAPHMLWLWPKLLFPASPLGWLRPRASASLCHSLIGPLSKVWPHHST